MGIERVWTTLRDAWHRLGQQDWAPVLGLGVLLRLLLMPVTWHNDAVWAPWMAHLMVEGSFNVYQTLLDRFGAVVLSPTVWAPYLPFYYYLMAGWTGLLSMLGLMNVSTWAFSHMGWTVPNFPRAVFLMKLPWLIADVATWGVVLSLLKPAKRRSFSWLYLFFPSQLWVSFVMGQNDILPTLAMVVALWCAGRALGSGRLSWSLGAVLSLGIGGGFKTYPLLLLLPTALILGQTVHQVALLALAGVAPFVLAVAPFVRTPAFVQGVLFNREGMTLLNVSMGTGLQVAPLFLVLYGLLLAYLAFGPRSRTLRMLRLAYWAVLLAVFVLSSWPFNWLVWLVPLLAWSVVEDDLPDVLYTMIGLYFCAYLAAWVKSIGGYTFYPLAPAFYYFSSFRELISPYLNFERAQSLAFAVFVTSMLVMFVLSLRPLHLQRKLGWSFGAWSTSVPALLLALMVVSSTLAGSQGFAVRVQNERTGAPIRLDSHTVIEQSFEMHIDGLCAVDVWVTDPLPSPDGGVLQITGRSQNIDLALASLDASEMIPQAMNRLDFGHVYPADVYTLTLQWTGNAPLLLGRSKSDGLPDGTLYIDGVPTEQDLAYQAISCADWPAIGRSISSRFLNDWGFTASWAFSLTTVAAVTIHWHTKQKNDLSNSK